jgi:hypothetical protein
LSKLRNALIFFKIATERGLDTADSESGLKPFYRVFHNPEATLKFLTNIIVGFEGGLKNF